MFRNLARTIPDGFAEVLLPFGLVAPDILMQRDGSFIKAWKYQGPDLQLETEAKMASLSERLNSVIRLGAGWMIHFHVFRFPASPYRKSNNFPDPIAALIEEERAAQAEKIGARLETEFFASLTYLPPTKSEYATEKFLYGAGDDAAAKSLATFQATTERFENVFGEIFHAERLGSRTEMRRGREIRFNDLLAYYRRCLTHVKAPFVEPEFPVYLNDILGRDVTTGERPRVGEQRIAVVSIDGFPSKSIPSILVNLDSLGFPYRWSTRAILLSREQGGKVFERLYKEYHAAQTSTADKLGMGDGMVDTDAVERTVEAQSARANVRSGNVQTCIYNGDIVILHENADELRRMAREAMKCIELEEGFSSRLETVNTMEGWLGTLPGDGYSNIRRVFMDTLNLSDLAPTSAAWTGREHNPSPRFPKNSPPLLIGKARGDAPFRYHAHTVGDVGNFILAGGMGSGKSALLSAMAVQWLKYPRARVIAIDRRLSMWPLCEAVGGTFYEPGEGNAGFCPLSQLDEKGEIEWAAAWLENLCELNGLKLSNLQRTYLHEGLTALASREPRLRTLSNAATLIQDEEIRLVLRHFSGHGAYAHLFDAERESFEESEYFNLIETQYLMNLDDKARVPAILYIAHRIDKMFDGRPTLLLLDEAVFLLGHSLFEEKIKTWLCTCRKENVALGLAVQQLAYLVNSAISSTLLGECPTKIFCPNPDAFTKGIGGMPGPYDYYCALGLNDKKIEAIRSAVPKRDYVIDSSLGTAVVNFDFGPVLLAFCGLNGDERREEFRNVIATSDAAGRDWRSDWLRHEALPKWATYLENQTGTVRMDEGLPLMSAMSAAK
jgi:type IV secretion system protein VirB4